VLVGCGGTRAPANAVSVPKAVGLDLVSATKAVKRSGLCWEIEFGNRGGTAIVRQKPRAGARVAPRTPVRLYLGLDFTTKPPEALAQAPGCPEILLTIVRPPP
jgi:hypothetical protein